MPGAADRLRRARALVFDFDGTLVDSNPIKARAFARCFADLEGPREEVLAYCLSHHHTPRGEKFRHVYERILARPYTEAVARRLHEQFEAATTEAIIRAPEMPGAAVFLGARTRGRVQALLSSTPHEVLLRILEGRGWRPLFDVVQGAPVDKAAWLRVFQAERGLAGGDVVFIGDTDEDEAAAQEAGCVFIHVGGASAADRLWDVADFRSLLP